jgi:hypothetical protein
MQTGGSERLRIDTSGNLGVGTSTPSSFGKFAVAGQSSLGVDQTDYVNILGASGVGRVEAVGSNTNVNLALSTKGTGEIYFWRGGYGSTQMALINQYGIGLGATTPSSGTGIKFPSTQSASSDANTLDDYEEGTWTPADASGAGLTFTSVTARYTKIGNVVYINAILTYPTTVDVSQAKISGLPFAPAVGAAILFGSQTLTSSGAGQGVVDASSTTMNLIAQNNASKTNVT